MRLEIMESIYKDGDIVYIERFNKFHVIDRVVEINIDNKIFYALDIGNNRINAMDARKATLTEIKIYKIKNMFNNKL